MEFHEYANIYPLMTGKPFDNLVSSIKKRGLNHDIALFEEKILDGRNRYKACIEAGVEPRFKTVTGTQEEMIDFVIDENETRRQLKHIELVKAGVAAQKLYEDAAKKKMLSTQNNNAARAALPDLTKQDQSPIHSRIKAAEKMGVAPTAIWQYEKIAEKSIPEVVEAVDAEKITLNRAITISKLPKTEQKEALARPTKSPVKKTIPKTKEVKPNVTWEGVKNGDIDPKTVKNGQILESRITVTGDTVYSELFLNPAHEIVEIFEELISNGRLVKCNF